METRNPHLGSSFDDFLKHESIFEEVQAKALERALAQSFEEGMSAKCIEEIILTTKAERHV